MPNIDQLVKRTSFLVDDVMETEQLISLFNEALESIDEVYGEAKRLEITLSEGEDVIQVPTEALEIIRVVVKDGNTQYEAQRISMNSHENYDGIYENPQFFSYNRFGFELTMFPKTRRSVNIVVEYYGANEKIPDVSLMPDLDYVPKIPERYHRALPLFAAARYFENWEDNPEQRNNYRKQFEEIRDLMAYQHDRKIRATRSKTTYVLRGWS